MDFRASVVLRGFLVLGFGLWSALSFGQRRILPHLTSATGGFASRVTLANPTAAAKAYRLLGFDQAGNVAATVEGALTPFQTVIVHADALFGMNLSHFEIEEGEGIAVSVVYQRDREETGPAHVHEAAVQARSWRVFSGNAAVTWDGLAAVNAGEAATDIRATQIDAAGRILAGPVTLAAGAPPNSKTLYLFSQDFDSVEAAFFDIDADEPLALLALRGNNASDFLWENKAIPLQQAMEPNRLIAHVASPAGGFRSQAIISNPFEIEKSYELHGYALSGASMGVATGSVPAGQTLYGDIEQLFGTNVSHFDIADDTEALVAVSYQRDRENAGPAQVRVQSRFGGRWRVYPGNPAVTWDGLAAVNQGAAPADVVVWQLDANGSVVKGPVVAIDQLAPKGKGLYLFASDFESEPGAFFEIEAAQPLAVMALRGNQASDFLWENTAVLAPQPQSAVPPARIDYALAFDPVNRVAVMVGGYDEAFDLLEDTWLWNGRSWRQVETSGSPLPRSHHGGAFDSANNRTIIFGGFQDRFSKRNDFMAFDGEGWSAFPGHPDIPAEDGELVFDPDKSVLILTVSNGAELETWEYGELGWARKITAANPGRRIDQGLVYDAQRQRVVLFGGLGAGNRPNNETWEYDGDNWTQAAPAASPPALMGMAMFYDSIRQRTVFFGGMNADRDIVAETWAYDGSAWVRLEPATSPTPRWVAFAAFDPKRGVAVLFGGEGPGENGVTVLRDTWEFDGTDWRRR